MAIYSKGKGKWRVRIWLNGKRSDWVVAGTKRDAKEFEARKRVEIGALGTMPERVAPKFSDFCLGSYAAHAKLRLKASTWSVRRYQIATLVGFFGDARLTAISTKLVDQFVRSRTAIGLRPTSVNNELAVLQAVLSYARSRDVPTAKPKIEMLTVRTRRHAAAWTAADMKRLLRACAEKSPGILPLVVFLANTGARKGEALALRWKDVDLKRKLIRIWPSDDWQPKDNDAREVPISDALLRVLRALPRKGPWVFPASHGGRYAFWPRKQFEVPPLPWTPRNARACARSVRWRSGSEERSARSSRRRPSGSARSATGASGRSRGTWT